SVAHEFFARLQHVDICALVMELVVLAIFLLSLGGLFLPVMVTWQGIVLVIGTLILGLLLPLILHARAELPNSQRVVIAARLSLVGGFVLRYAMLTAPAELLARAPELRARYAVDGGDPI